MAFSFRVTPGLIVLSIAYAAGAGLIRGLAPALRAARAPVAVGLRS